jgi:transposase-like protein
MRPKGSAAVLAARRRRALELLDEGLSLNEVARRIGCQASSVMRWRDRRDRVGEKVYEVGASPGRPPKLSPAQKPERRALERNEERIERWKRTRWPQVEEDARRQAVFAPRSTAAPLRLTRPSARLKRLRVGRSSAAVVGRLGGQSTPVWGGCGRKILFPANTSVVVGRYASQPTGCF